MEGNPARLMAFDRIDEFNHTCEEVMSVRDTGTSQAEARPLEVRTLQPSPRNPQSATDAATGPSHPALVLVGLATGAAFAAASLLTSAVLIRLAWGPDPGILAMVILASATLTGTLAGSWLVQPLVTRLVLGASPRR